MDNLITGLFAVVIFIAFVIGLAESINAIPFWIIVSTVCVLLLIDFSQSVKSGFKDHQDKN